MSRATKKADFQPEKIREIFGSPTAMGKLILDIRKGKKAQG